MADRKHRGDHGRRTQERDAARIRKQTSAAKAATDVKKGRKPGSLQKPHRVFLRNRLYIGLTLLAILGVGLALVIMGNLDLWDNFFGSVLCILIGAFGCMCLYDVGLLMTACISFGEGMVNAGKNDAGQLMLFHAASVVRVEMRDPAGHTLPRDQAVYKNADITFVMQSGRVNLRRVSRLTQKQLARVIEALEAEKTYQE